MPSTSKAQKRFMQAAAHDLAFAKRAGVPQKVAKEFEAADKGRPEPKQSRAERRYGSPKNGKA